MWTLVSEIYEPQRPFPIVVHRFNGETQQEAQGYYISHMRTDAFLSNCTRSGQFGNIRCRSTLHWEKDGMMMGPVAPGSIPGMPPGGYGGYGGGSYGGGGY